MQKFFETVTNLNGDAVSGATATVTTIAGGTAVIYSDNSSTLIVGNAVTTNSSGYFEFYAADGRYNVTITGTGINTRVISDVLLEDPADSPSPTTADLISTASSKGAGLVGFLYASTYAASTVGKWLQDLATSAGAAFIGFIQSGTGAVLRTLQAESRDRLTVTQFGADPTGVADSSAAIAAAIAAMPNPSMLIFPKGTYTVNTEILIPYTGVNGSGKTLHFEGCILQAGANSIALLHWAESRGVMTGSVKFATNGHTGISGLRLTPTSESGTTVIANQNYNNFGAEMQFIGLDEGIVLQTGPQVTGTDSGCWYNQFTGALTFGSCKRCVWIKDGNLGAGSGANANSFAGGLVMNGSINTGIHIQNGGGNIFFFPQFENIATGTSPSATPTGLIVANTAANGNSNPDNTFYSAHWENCTLNASILNANTKIYVTDTDLFNTSGQITAYTEQYRQAYTAKGALISSIFNLVTSVANIKGLWLFDEFGSNTTIIDRSTKAHTITLRNGSLSAIAANTWGPRITGSAFNLTYGDESHLWNTPDHNDFSFGDGATDSAFSIVTLIMPTLAADCEVFSKDDLTTASNKREYSLAIASTGTIEMFLFDNSAGSLRARTAPAATVTANVINVVGVTYDGSSTAAGIKLYNNGIQVDNATVTSGAYTAMENLAALPASYRVAAAGTPERPFKGRLYVQMVVAEQLTANQMLQLSYLLRSYAGASLT